MLTQTIHQQLKGMFFWYAFAGIALFFAVHITIIPYSFTDIFPPFIQMVTLIWPILSASLLFNKEFQNGSLPYLFGAPQSRKQLLTKKILPGLILGIIPFLFTIAVIPIIIPGNAPFSILPYFVLYLTVSATATLFSFLPSILAIFTLSLVSSVALWTYIPLSCFMVSFWQNGAPLRNFLYGPLFSSGPISSIGDALATLSLFSVLPIVLLFVWLWGFMKYAEPDHRRFYRKTAPKIGLILTGTAALIFGALYLFLPVTQWGDYRLTREGHLFFHGFRSAQLITDNESFTLPQDRNCNFLAETDSELILTVPGGKNQINLIGWNKNTGQKRQICSVPASPTQHMIFQPPNVILCLAESRPREWTEIELNHGGKTRHTFIPLGHEGDKKSWYPIARVFSGDTHMILISNPKYFGIDYGSPLPLTLCQADTPPRYLGESVGLPVQISETEIVMAMRTRHTMEKYRLVDGQFSLVESASIPKINYWRIVRDYRFWKSQQALFGICGQYTERTLLTVHLNPLVTTLTALEPEETGLIQVATTPNWSALIKRDPNSGVYHITRLDQQQPPFTYAQSHRQVYFNAQSYGFLISDQDRPSRWRIQFPAGKTERLPTW